MIFIFNRSPALLFLVLVLAFLFLFHMGGGWKNNNYVGRKNKKRKKRIISGRRLFLPFPIFIFALILLIFLVAKMEEGMGGGYYFIFQRNSFYFAGSFIRWKIMDGAAVYFPPLIIVLSEKSAVYLFCFLIWPVFILIFQQEIFTGQKQNKTPWQETSS